MPNALAAETSPYLLQHAGNPVDWVPWSEEAFARARAEDRLVFLSIGYSTCHWCHVMEHESFEDEAIAAVMNRHFVCIKVDREERPDLDAAYMAYVQATTGQGGWPMSVWLTPEGRPVVGGTYFPPEDRHGRIGFPRLCGEIARLWQEDRRRMEESADKVMAHLREEAATDAVLHGLPPAKVYGDFLDRCEGGFDGEWGGWGRAPKFPRPAVPQALLQLAERLGGEDAEAALQMVERSLRAMAAGGMNDQLGGGFHRYSVDRYWHVPHYEKMLYDQGQLATLYLDAWRATGVESFRTEAERIFGYVLRDLTDAGGAFHAAEDADSLPEPGAARKLEGAYWTWTAEEIYERLDPRSAALFCGAYGVTAEGNARPESDPHGELEGRNTLYRALDAASLAERFEITEAEVAASLEKARQVLLEARADKPLPHRDDKIVAAWNGLMIAALAKGARMLERPDLAAAAQRALIFLKRELWDGERLWRSFRGRRGAAPGFPADYACLIAALIEMQGVTLEPGLEGDAGRAAWRDWALELQEALDREHWEAERAGYVLRPELGGETLLVIREDYDGAEPAANHVAAVNLLKLAVLAERPDYARRAEAILRAGSRTAAAQPFAVPIYLMALDLLERGVIQVEQRGKLAPDLQQVLTAAVLPRALWVRTEEGPGDVVVCKDTVCLPPVRSVEEWEKSMVDGW